MTMAAAIEPEIRREKTMHNPWKARGGLGRGIGMACRLIRSWGTPGHRE